MVRIPERPYAQLAGGRLEAPAARRSQMFDALGRGGEQIFRAALVLQDRLDHNYLVEAQNEYTRSMTDFGLQAEQERQGENAAGFTQDFEARQAETVSDITARMQDKGLSRNGQRAFEHWAMDRGMRGRADAARFEHRQMVAFGQDQHALRLQGIEDMLGRNPGNFADAFAQLEESFALAVGQGIYRASEAKVRLADARDKLKSTAFENLYAVDRGRAMQSMGALGLDAAEQARAKKRYQSDLRADAAHARAAQADKVRGLALQVEDVDYLARTSGDVGELRTLAGSFAALGEKETAAKLSTRADLYENNAGAIKESRAMPLPELVKTIESMAADLTAAAESKDANKHRMLTEELKLRAGVYEERRKALEKDPAGAVAADAEAALPPELADNPAARTDMRLAAQENNGVPQSMRRVLTNSEAARLKEAWLNGDLQTRLAVSASLEKYGPHAGNVAQEIGLAPSEQLLVERARRDPRAAGALASVITASATKPEALPKLEKADSLAREAAESSEVVRASRAAAAAMPGIPAYQVMTRNYEDTLARLVRMNGGNTDAARDMLDGQLRSLADGKNFALMYDPAEIPGNADLEGALRAAQSADKVDALAAGRRWTDDFERQNWVEHITRSGVWVNAPDADGWMLFDPIAQAPAMDGAGNVIRVRPKDVTGTTVPPAWGWQGRDVRGL